MQELKGGVQCSPGACLSAYYSKYMEHYEEESDNGRQGLLSSWILESSTNTLAKLKLASLRKGINFFLNPNITLGLRKLAASIPCLLSQTRSNLLEN